MNRASYYRPPAEGMFIIQDSGGLYFIGTMRIGAKNCPGWGSHEEDAYAMPTRSLAERWIERIRASPGNTDRDLRIVLATGAEVLNDMAD